MLTRSHARYLAYSFPAPPAPGHAVDVGPLRGAHRPAEHWLAPLVGWARGAGSHAGVWLSSPGGITGCRQEAQALESSGVPSVVRVGVGWLVFPMGVLVEMALLVAGKNNS